VKEAIKLGVRHIDCAAIYGNEKEIGEAFQELFKEGIVKREDLWITSKLWNTDHDADNVRKACEKTIADLQCDYLDLYLVHFPLAFEHTSVGGSPGFKLDDEGKCKMARVPLHVTWAAMEALVEGKLTKSIGISNYPFIMFEDAMAYAKIKPVTNQIEAHPYFANDWFCSWCKREGVVITAHTPLGGAKANAEWRGASESPLDDPVIQTIAEKHGKSVAQICIRWALDRGTVVIPKSTKPHRIAENFGVLDFSLTEGEVASITALDKKQRSNKSGRSWGIKFQA